MKKELTHVNRSGEAAMVDVGRKPQQLRSAKASGRIKLSPQTVALIRDNNMKKGDVLTVAKIAGIQAAKMTPNLIPLCHPLNLTHIDVITELTDEGVTVTAETKCIGQTGVEMEALTAVHAALLTVYDMCKAVDKNMETGEIKLLEKKKEDL